MSRVKPVIPISDTYVSLRESDHRYFSTDGMEWTSWSAVSKSIVEPFYANAIASKMSQGSSLKAKALLAEWDEIRNRSCEHGHDIHSRMEDFIGRGIIDWEIGDMQQRLYDETLVGYEQLCVERVCYMRWQSPTDPSRYGLYAGTADKLLIRPSRGVVDIADYKTNLRHGIRFDSSFIDKNNGKLRFGNRYMLSPVEHLEECEYNKYALQLSAYGLMLMQTYGVKVGKMYLIYIYQVDEVGGAQPKRVFDYKIIPMPFMLREVTDIYNYHVDLKPIKPF